MRNMLKEQEFFGRVYKVEVIYIDNYL